MDTIQNIYSRRSVRKYTEKQIDDEILKQILTAGMSGPSAVNKRPFEFLVSNKKRHPGKNG